jgi:hypothetical protein
MSLSILLPVADVKQSDRRWWVLESSLPLNALPRAGELRRY